MSCRKALEIDVAAYLADPDGSSAAEFRAHYPACPDCAREVASWSHMETRVRNAVASDDVHLPAELLARFEEDPQNLPADQWQRADAHLQSCGQCADRLAALRAFDFSALTAGAPPSRLQTLRDAAGSIGRRLRSLLPAGSSEASEALEDLLPWAEPELALQSSDEEAGRPAPRRGAAPARVPLGVLVAVGGDLAGSVYALFPGENRIGRAPECEIRLASDGVGRVEARLTVAAGSFELTSLHEGRPVVVGGVPSASVALRDGDLLEIGSERLQLRTVAGAPPAHPRSGSTREP